MLTDNGIQFADLPKNRKGPTTITRRCAPIWVTVGEKVMALAEERDTEIEAWLAPGDAIALQAGASATLFRNAAPLSPVKGAVRYVAYEAVPRPDGTTAHRVRAGLAESEAKARLGLKGTARLSGETVSLAYWLLRRPLAAVHAAVGL